MIVAGSGLRVVVATRPVDFRMGHDGGGAPLRSSLASLPNSVTGRLSTRTRQSMGAVGGLFPALTMPCSCSSLN